MISGSATGTQEVHVPDRYPDWLWEMSRSEEKTWIGRYSYLYSAYKSKQSLGGWWGVVQSGETSWLVIRSCVESCTY